MSLQLSFGTWVAMFELNHLDPFAICGWKDLGPGEALLVKD
jgi:hypothetical protein